MKHFVLSVTPNQEGVIHLYEKDYHYLARVRRLKAGDVFDALLPGGAETRVRILSTADNILIGVCAGAAAASEISSMPRIALFQGLPKGPKMDLIVRQAAEGGLSVVAPFEAEYSTVRLGKGAGGPDDKTKRWERIVKEARQQSGSLTGTTVRPPCDFAGLMDYWESLKEQYSRPLGIVFHQDPLEKGTFHDYLGTGPDFVALAVGPEGGFSPGEVSRFLAAGFRPLLMGNTVLRTETAALYASAAVRIILLEKASWTAKPGD